MSAGAPGFSSAWLDAREPADRAARDAGLLSAVAARLAGRESPSIVDLGAGTGSTLRAVAPALGPRQRWTLVDGDPALVAAARLRLAAWAAGEGLVAEEDGDGLRLVGGGREITVGFVLADLSETPLPVDGAIDLVAASALFDLASADFVGRLADAVAAHQAGFYAALDVDGAVDWATPLPEDAAVAAAFCAHQGRDKGFGPALGPGASDALTAAFSARGYAVATAASPWRIAPDDPLGPLLVDGWAGAAAETGLVAADLVSRWRARRRLEAACTVGHRDTVAWPTR